MELQTEEETTVEMSVSVASQDIRLVENLHVTVGFRSLCSEQNLGVFFFLFVFYRNAFKCITVIYLFSDFLNSADHSSRKMSKRFHHFSLEGLS